MTYPRGAGLSYNSMRLATFLLVFVALILIAPIAFASSPDPSWIAGIYDGADGDDVVSLVYEAAGIESGLFQLAPPHLRPSKMQCLSRLGVGHAFSVCTLTRGPPSTSGWDLLPPQLLSPASPHNTPSHNPCVTSLNRPADDHS